MPFTPKAALPSRSFSFTMLLVSSPTPSFPGAWPDLSSTDIVPPLPDKIIPPDTVEIDDSPQDTSPSLLCLSPRPLPELPSLSSSLSTADSSVTTSSSIPPERPCSPVEVQPAQACTPLRTDSPVVFDLREPRSPDSAHFSPAIDSTSFPSPSSSHLHLSLSNNCPGAPSAESVATCHPSPSRPSTPDAEGGVHGDEESHPDTPGEEITHPRSQGGQQEHLPHAAKISVGKGAFLGRIKRFGGRVRKLFKPRVVETKPRRDSTSSLASPRKPSLPISMRLPVAVPESPRGRQSSEAPYFISRRFSLQSLLHPRLPRDPSSGATEGNRISTAVSAQDKDRVSPQDTRLPDVTGICHPEVHSERDHHWEQKAEKQVPVTTEVLHGALEPSSVASLDSA